MPENSTLQTDALVIARKARAMNVSQAQIAEAISASQSQVSRVLSGNAHRRSRLFIEVCEYVNSIAFTDRSDAIAKNEELMSAISSVWNGTPQHAKALALVIRSLAIFSPKELTAPAHQPKSQQGR